MLPIAAAAGLSTLVDDRCGILTVTGGVAIGRGQAWGTGDTLPDTVAHVAGWSGPESVDHELAAVPHGDVQLPHAALPVLVDARRTGHDPLGNAGDGPWNDKQVSSYSRSRVSGPRRLELVVWLYEVPLEMLTEAINLERDCARAVCVFCI